MNHTDICELEDEKSIISCLRERFKNQMIYTYIAKVLIALNPYKNINGLYRDDKVKSYQTNNNEEPHLFAIANRAIRRINPERPQSIILTGLSGSGKTKSATYIQMYLGSDQINQRISAGNSILELFGNAETSLNENSSRFSKLTKIRFHSDLTLVSVQFTYLLLESNRVYIRNANESNFHILHAMKFVPEDLCKKLSLDLTEEYTYLSGCNYSMNSANFQSVEALLTNAGISKEKRMKIYETLAAILHLGNVVIEDDISEGKCKISNLSMKHLENVARLLQIEKVALESALLSHNMEVMNRESLTIPLSLSKAIKVQQTLAKILYENLFQNVVNLINEFDSDQVELLHLSLLDIAGFESFGTKNHFEQLCINYINEKIQQMFVRIMLKDEQDWYIQECLEIPTIPFLDNSPILDIFEHNSKGIFKLLDDACKIQLDFVVHFLSCWTNSIVRKPKPKEVQSTGFTIRHFAGDVVYQTDKFVEKNKNLVPKSINDICQRINISVKNVNTSHDSLHNKSATFMLKMGTTELIKNLNETECSFVRCIKPNENQSSNTFDENLVLSQLASTGCIAYQKLMRSGYPVHMKIEDLLNQCKKMLKLSKSVENQKEFCSTILRSCGLRWKDFRIGNRNVFFRSEKMDIITENMKDEVKVQSQFMRLNFIRAKWRIMRIVVRFCFKPRIANYPIIASVNLPSSSNMEDANLKQPNERYSKKRKLDNTVPDGIPHQTLAQAPDRTTITISSNEVRTPNSISIENELRNLLRLERQKNFELNADYLKLQKKYLELRKENERLRSGTQDSQPKTQILKTYAGKRNRMH